MKSTVYVIIICNMLWVIVVQLVMSLCMLLFADLALSSSSWGRSLSVDLTTVLGCRLYALEIICITIFSPFWCCFSMKPDRPGRDRLETWLSLFCWAVFSLFRAISLHLDGGSYCSWELQHLLLLAAFTSLPLKQEDLRLRGGFEGREVDGITYTASVREPTPAFCVDR